MKTLVVAVCLIIAALIATIFGFGTRIDFLEKRIDNLQMQNADLTADVWNLQMLEDAEPYTETLTEEEAILKILESLQQADVIVDYQDEERTFHVEIHRKGE